MEDIRYKLGLEWSCLLGSLSEPFEYRFYYDMHQAVGFECIGTVTYSWYSFKNYINDEFNLEKIYFKDIENEI